MFILLVCGGRDYHNKKVIYSILDQVHEIELISLVVQGFATGADRLADSWANSRGVPSTERKYEITRDMWRKQGKAAGYIRNNKMLTKEKPDMVLGFHGGDGTDNMCRIAKRAFVPVIRVDYAGRIL